MAWNDPGSNQPPGGNQGSGSGRPPQDELDQVKQQLSRLFGGGDDQPAGPLAVIVLVALTLLWVAGGAYQVDEQERAVVLRFGAFHEIVGPGFQWNPPLVDTVLKENITRFRSYSTQGAMLTSDENIVEVQLSVQYNISDLRKFALANREPELALNEATDSALRHIVGNSTMDDVLTTGRDKIAVDVKARLQSYLDTYETGIQVNVVNVEKTQAPKEVQAAFDDVSKAREDEQRVQNEAQSYANSVVPDARGLAARVKQEAIGYRERVIARAQGEAVRFEALLTEYRKAPEVTRQRLYLEAMQDVMEHSSKVLVDVDKGSNMLYLPLDQLRASANSNASATNASGSSNNSATNSGNSNNTANNTASASAVSQADIDAMARRIEDKLRTEMPTRRREIR